MSLILLPNLLDTSQRGGQYFTQNLVDIMSCLDGLIAESEKEGRRFLSRFKLKKDHRQIPIALLNEHIKKGDIDFLLEPIQQGENWGVVSDCGLPCIADPGSLLVFRARTLNLPIVAYPGPSSIMLGLMLSGFSGQKFAFHGYLHKEDEKRRKDLILWEKRSKNEHETQIFMEAPYRNLMALECCLQTLSPSTFLSLAVDLSTPTEWVQTLSIHHWKQKALPSIQKRPTIFLFYQN